MRTNDESIIRFYFRAAMTVNTILIIGLIFYGGYKKWWNSAEVYRPIYSTSSP